MSKPITKDELYENLTRNAMATSVTLPSDKWEEILNLALLGIDHRLKPVRVPGLELVELAQNCTFANMQAQCYQRTEGHAEELEAALKYLLGGRTEGAVALAEQLLERIAKERK